MVIDPDLRGLLGAAFERSVVAMLLVDPDGTILQANPRAETLLNPGWGSIVGRAADEFWVDAGPPIGATLEFRTGASDHLHRPVDLRTPGSALLTVDLSADVVISATGRRLWLIQLAEITAVRRDQRELSVAEQRYHLLADNLPESSVIMFDRDLRITLARGEALIKSGLSSVLTVGSHLRDALPASGFAILEPHYSAALAGNRADFDYLSPVTGLQFRIRTLPVTDHDGSIVGGLALTSDVSADRQRQSRLAQLYHLTNVGTCSYSLAHGWSFDENLLRLWGFDTAMPDATTALSAAVLDEDRLSLRAAQERLALVGGRSSFSYRLRHAPSGEIRYLHCTFESVVNDDGVLVTATATHIDVTDAAEDREVVQRIGAQAAADQRSMLLRRVSDALAVAQTGPAQPLRSIADLAAADLAAAAVLRVLTPDHTAVELDITSHPDARRRRDIEQAMTRSRQSFEPGPIRDQVIRQARIVSTVGPTAPLENNLRFAEQTGWRTAHSITAPIRHEGAVLGLFSVIRSEPRLPFETGDENLVQVLADFAGTAIAEHRVRTQLETTAAHRLEELSVQQRDQLQELAGMESRERWKIAESIHDEPIQLIVAAAIRIDLLRAGALQAHPIELDRLTVLLDESVDWLRTLVDIDLTPPDLSHGLLDALRTLGRVIVGPATELTITGPRAVNLLAPATSAAYKIVREALLNAEQHAKATAISVQVTDRDRQVIFTIDDDGVGAAGLPGPEHLGLAAMRIRAEAEGGQLTIRSSPGSGTTVTLILPGGEP